MKTEVTHLSISMSNQQAFKKYFKISFKTEMKSQNCRPTSSDRKSHQQRHTMDKDY